MGQVELIGVSKGYEQVTVLDGIDLDIEMGELLVLVGPSGCGKSTLLRSIAGLETIDRGEVRINGRVVAAPGTFVPPRDRDVAMVFQNYALYPHMTVAENLGFGLRMRRVARTEREAKVRDMAKLLGLEALLGRKPAQLSGGQQQRVAVGRALVRDPQVFLLDEPLSNLDTELRNQTRGELKRLHQRLQTTMVYVTHDQVEAMTLADRIVVLDRGRVQQVGTPQNIYQNPASTMVAQFMGNPPMNLFELVRRENVWMLLDEPLALPEPFWLLLEEFGGERILLGVRPENLNFPAHPAQPVVPFRVEIIEPLGNETIVQGRVGAVEVSLRLDRATLVQRGECLPVGLDLGAAVLFETETGMRVHAPS